MFIRSETSPLGESDADPFLSLAGGATEVYLIRHANALSSTNEVADGSYDDQSLSELGRQQSLALAERMREIAVAAIYSSPIKRAWQTASIVGEALGLEVHADEGLREVGLPPLQAHVGSQEYATIMRTYLRELEAAALRVGIWSQIPGCEPSAMLRARLTSAVDRIVSQHVGERVAIVSHSGAINAYIAAILGLERDFFFLAANTSISVVRVKGQQHLLMRLNDAAHC